MDIYIAPEKILTQYECGFQAKVSPLLVGPRMEHLDDLDYTQLDEKVTFFMKKWYGWSPLFLPDAFEKATREFLQKWHGLRDESFDCYAFANLLVGNALHPVEQLLDFWNIQHVPMFGVIGHKIIFLVDEKECAFGHAALHIGQGYFLSVQGAGGSLSVATLTDMREAYYMRPDVLIATPRLE